MITLLVVNGFMGGFHRAAKPTDAPVKRGMVPEYSENQLAKPTVEVESNLFEADTNGVIDRLREMPREAVALLSEMDGELEALEDRVREIKARQKAILSLGYASGKPVRIGDVKRWNKGTELERILDHANTTDTTGGNSGNG